MLEKREYNVILALKEMLLQNSYAIGDRLPSERELAESFGVSRNTIRGAMRTLAGSGIIEVRRSSGNYLLSKSALDRLDLDNTEDDDKKRISEQLEAFFLFEPTAVQLAAERMDDMQKKKLEDCVVRMSNAILENDTPGIVESHRNFHQVIAAGTSNRLMIQMLERLEITYVKVSNIMQKISQAERNKVFARHVNLYKAIESGDKEMARKMSLQMILSTSLLLARFEGIELPDIINKEIGNQVIEMKIKQAEHENE